MVVRDRKMDEPSALVEDRKIVDPSALIDGELASMCLPENLTWQLIFNVLNRAHPKLRHDDNLKRALSNACRTVCSTNIGELKPC
jgi:hypothetical protein